jgi:hypothetical protein
MKGKKVSYAESEQLSSILLDRWNSVGAITMVSKNTWRVNTLVQPKIAAEPEAALA